MFTRIRYWLRATVRRSAVERELRDEMQLHLDRQIDLLVARGMTRADARIAARREFGNVGVHQENARDIRPARWIDSVGADIRFAFRFFARKPLSSTTIVLVLASACVRLRAPRFPRRRRARGPSRSSSP